MTKEERERYAAALIREREMVAVKGDQDRLDAIDAELRKVGAQAAKPQRRAEKR